MTLVDCIFILAALLAVLLLHTPVLVTLVVLVLALIVVRAMPLFTRKTP